MAIPRIAPFEFLFNIIGGVGRGIRKNQIDWNDPVDDSYFTAEVRRVQSTVGGDGLTAEEVRDLVAAFVRPGTGITVTHDDSGDTLTIASAIVNTDTQLSAEQVQDIVAAFIQQGSNVTAVYDDAANTLTINSTGGGNVLDTISEDGTGSATAAVSQEAIAETLYRIRHEELDRAPLGFTPAAQVLYGTVSDLSPVTDGSRATGIVLDSGPFDQALRRSIMVNPEGGGFFPEGELEITVGDSSSDVGTGATLARQLGVAGLTTADGIGGTRQGLWTQQGADDFEYQQNTAAGTYRFTIPADTYRAFILSMSALIRTQGVGDNSFSRQEVYDMRFYGRAVSKSYVDEEIAGVRQLPATGAGDNGKIPKVQPDGSYELSEDLQGSIGPARTTVYNSDETISAANNWQNLSTVTAWPSLLTSDYYKCSPGQVAAGQGSYRPAYWIRGDEIAARAAGTVGSATANGEEIDIGWAVFLGRDSSSPPNIILASINTNDRHPAPLLIEHFDYSGVVSGGTEQPYNGPNHATGVLFQNVNAGADAPPVPTGLSYADSGLLTGTGDWSQASSTPSAAQDGYEVSWRALRQTTGTWVVTTGTPVQIFDGGTQLLTAVFYERDGVTVTTVEADRAYVQYNGGPLLPIHGAAPLTEDLLISGELTNDTGPVLTTAQVINCDPWRLEDYTELNLELAINTSANAVQAIHKLPLPAVDMRGYTGNQPRTEQERTIFLGWLHSGHEAHAQLVNATVPANRTNLNASRTWTRHYYMNLQLNNDGEVTALIVYRASSTTDASRVHFGIRGDRI